MFFWASASFHPLVPCATMVAPPAVRISSTPGIDPSFSGTPASPSSTAMFLLSPSWSTSHSAPTVPALAQSVDTV